MLELSPDRRGGVAGFVVPGLIGLIWLGLTWRTGLTYHFMPLAIGASGVTARWLAGASMTRGEAVLYAGWGLLAVGGTWAAMFVGRFTPDATFVSGQPGGVVGEVAVFGVLGALSSAVYASRR